MDDQEIEFIIVSENNFEKLKLFQKDKIEVDYQVYEDVAGFEPLNSKLQTRTTAFSCKDDSEDYDESFLMSRPLPWVVRVFFKSEDSMKGTLCSGKLVPAKLCPWECSDSFYSKNKIKQLLLIIFGWSLRRNVV